MFVKDLAPLPGVEGALAVGWLEGDHAYASGSVSDEFLDALFEACVSKEIRKTRGWHPCTLCGPGAPYPIVEMRNGNSESLGHSEIEVTGPDRVRYAAPQLIYHYVVHHHYQPPIGFVQAVLHGEFAERISFVIRDFQRVEPELGSALKRGLTRRLGLTDDLADRIDLRIALVTIHSSFSCKPHRDVSALYVARHLIEIPWDGSVESGLAILESFCTSNELVFDEYWAKWR